MTDSSYLKPQKTIPLLLLQSVFHDIYFQAVVFQTFCVTCFRFESLTKNI